MSVYLDIDDALDVTDLASAFRLAAERPLRALALLKLSDLTDLPERLRTEPAFPLR